MNSDDKKQKQMKIQGNYRKVINHDRKPTRKSETIIVATIVFILVLISIIAGPGIDFFLN